MPSFSDINPASIRVDNVVELKEGRGKLVKLVQEDGSKVCFQSPPMSLAWDTRVRAQSSGQTSCGLALSFANGNERCAQFSAWLNALRDHLAGLVQKNSAEWYGKQLNDMQVQEYMTSMVREPPANSAFSATFIPKVAYTSDPVEGTFKITLNVFDAAGNPLVPEDVLLKDTRCSAIVSVPYIHISKGAKMLSIRADVTQVLAIPNIRKDTFAFDIESDPELRAAAEAAEKKRQEEEAALHAAPVPAADDGLAEPPASKMARVMQKEMADHDAHDDV